LRSPIGLIAGLGNPGDQYERSRHNAGFWFIDALASQIHVTLRSEARFHGALARVVDGERTCWLLKPATFMNRSGVAVAAAAQYYRIAVDRILVVHDDLDLPPGVARLKRGGGHGGHNGLRDVIARLGDGGFARLRIGIGHPGMRDDVTGFVLSAPGREDAQQITAAVHAALQLVDLLLSGDLERAMHRLHSRETPNRRDGPGTLSARKE
jgi:PTH1 family peptidyl-tRNA hydrolase